jgi:predicted membrane protein (TIGR00267 family)
MENESSEEGKQNMISMSAKLKEFSQYRRLSDLDKIGRRSFANNAFDGILTMIGVLMGSYIARISDPHIILYTGLATCLAMGVSGFSGAYMAESAERQNDLRQLEHAMLKDLQDTTQARAHRFAVIMVALIDGISPLISGTIVLLPFLLMNAEGSMQYSYIGSLGIAMVMLFGLGAFLAKVSKGSILRSGLRMILAGVACVLLSFLIGIKA